MADAEFTFKATGAETVVAANKRIETSMKQQAKASSKSGYAILEASRALEDFSMAGMRGALNNIPQLLMNLGVGAGLTGVLGALTVVVWKGTEYLQGYLDKLQAITEASAEMGIPQLNVEGIEESFNEETVKKAKEINDVFKEMADTQDYLNTLTERYFSEADAGSALNFAQEMLNLTKYRASEDEKGLANLKNKIELQERLVEAAIDESTNKQATLEDTIKIKKELESTVDKVDRLNLDDINKKVANKYSFYANRLLGADRKQLVEQGYLPKSFMDGGSKITDEDKIKLTKKASQLAAEDRKKMLEARGLSDKSITAMIQEAAIAKEKIKTIDDEIKKNERLLVIAKEKEAGAKVIAEFKIEELKLQEEMASLERKQKQDDEEKKKLEDEDKRRKSLMDKQKAIDASVFLSEQGRAGLAGTEAKVAMDTLGVAKQSLNALKQIVRNTSNKRITYA